MDTLAEAPDGRLYVIERGSVVIQVDKVLSRHTRAGNKFDIIATEAGTPTFETFNAFKASFAERAMVLKEPVRIDWYRSRYGYECQRIAWAGEAA